MLSGVEIKYKETDLQKKSGLGGKDELFFTLIVKKSKGPCSCLFFCAPRAVVPGLLAMVSDLFYYV